MWTSNKKEYMIVLVLILIILGIGLLMSAQHPELEYRYPDQPALLNNNDFTINTDHGLIDVGKTSFAEVNAIYPEGKTLGMSTIYSPANSGCLFTFAKKENILIAAHINTNQVSTFRHVKVNDSFNKVVKAYGENYARVSQKGDKIDFDVVYGSANTIIFQVRHNLVNKIIIQREMK